MPFLSVVASRFRLWHPRYWLVWLGMLCAAMLAQLPFRWQLCMGRLLGRLLYRIMTRRRHIAERNLELCFPQWSLSQRDAMVKKHFESNGMAVFESGMAWFMPRWRLRNRFVFKGIEHWRAIQTTTPDAVETQSMPRQGALVMAIHFATLEITNVAINRLFDLSMSYRPHNNPVYNYVQKRGRERHNPRSRAVNRNDIRGMLRALKQGHWLWYAADQDYGPNVSEFVPFFGIDAAMVAAPPRLATIANVPVVGITYRRLDDYSGYEITFLPPFSNMPSGDNLQDLRVLNQHFERCIRDNIAEYLWVHRRFKTRRQGTQSVYQR